MSVTNQIDRTLLNYRGIYRKDAALILGYGAKN